MKIVFMGTPDFAVASLKRLVADGHDICGVFTQPDKPKNRGMKLIAPPVKEYALTQGLHVYQPLKMKDGTALELVRSLAPELIVVAAYGRILPEDILNTPKYGAINVHSSILPKYRGAAPINWAIINGERETGVTTFLLNHEIDKGAILAQARMPILPEDNVGTMYDKLMHRGTELVLDTVERLAAGDVTPVAQPEYDDGQLKPAPKLFKEDCRIDWSLPGRRIVDFVRGLSPYPAAWSGVVRDGESEPATSVKIFTARFEAARHGEQPGSLFSDGRTLRVACVDGWIWLDELQMAGKKRLPVRELLLGWRDVNNCSFR